jgi:hypothetical protein
MRNGFCDSFYGNMRDGILNETLLLGWRLLAAPSLNG